MTPFQRLGLFAGSATVAGGIAAVAFLVSGWVGAVAAVGGAGLAILATAERTPPPVEAEPDTDPGAVGDAGMVVSTRADVERRARAAQVIDDDD